MRESTSESTSGLLLTNWRERERERERDKKKKEKKGPSTPTRMSCHYSSWNMGTLGFWGIPSLYQFVRVVAFHHFHLRQSLHPPGTSCADPSSWWSSLRSDLWGTRRESWIAQSLCSPPPHHRGQSLRCTASHPPSRCAGSSLCWTMCWDMLGNSHGISQIEICDFHLIPWSQHRYARVWEWLSQLKPLPWHENALQPFPIFPVCLSS